MRGDDVLTRILLRGVGYDQYLLLHLEEAREDHVPISLSTSPSVIASSYTYVKNERTLGALGEVFILESLEEWEL